MKQSINNYEFHRAFEQIRPDNFSYAGLDALFEYLESYEDDTGEEIAEHVTEWLQERTQVMPVDSDTLIIQAF